MYTPKMPIDELLRWAYRDELPKAQAGGPRIPKPDGYRSPGANLVRTGELGLPIQEPDVRNRFGIVPDTTAQTGPHVDAVTVWMAVQDLASLILDLPVDWYPLSDLGDLGDDGHAAVANALRKISITDRIGERHLRDSHAPPFLVQRAAIHGPPEWECEKPVRKIEKLQDGRIRWYIKQLIHTDDRPFEIEVDGYDHSTRLPKTGAYKKTYLDPDPTQAAINRADYAIWHASLGVLVGDVKGKLHDVEATPTELPAAPWETGAPPAPNILMDLTLRRPIVREPRPLAGPPPYRGMEREKDEPNAA